MSKLASLDKDQLVEVLANSNDCCLFGSYYTQDACDDPASCAELLNKWFDKESI